MMRYFDTLDKVASQTIFDLRIGILEFLITPFAIMHCHLPPTLLIVLFASTILIDIEYQMTTHEQATHRQKVQCYCHYMAQCVAVVIFTCLVKFVTSRDRPSRIKRERWL